jgi:HJR/Mrr/RecB family endonuclease
MKASDAAYRVLTAAGEPLHKDELTKRMIESSLWQSEGKTPSATVTSILGTEIAELGAASRFIRREPNVFDLRRDDDPVPALEAPGDGPKAWMFQANPKRHDLLAGIAAHASDVWAMNQHRDHAAQGDRVHFFLSGDQAGIYAVGRITSTAFRAEKANEFGEWKVDIIYEALVESPLLRNPDIAADPVLASFSPFMGRMGTNFPIPPSVAARLETVLAARLKPVKASAGSAPFSKSVHDLNQAVEAARLDAKLKLLDHLRALTADQFQHVIRVLLDALGYEAVKVTGQSGDRGIDVKAVLRYRGIADVPTYVQAKRYAAGNNVDGATVGRLRGSLPVEAHGIVITTSDFTKQARSEATATGLKPIALINGPALVELLVDLGIGVEKRQVEVIRFDPSRLDEDLVQ